jgi:hypothetical protein
MSTSESGVLSITQKCSLLDRGRKVSSVVALCAEAEGDRRDQSGRSGGHKRSIGTELLLSRILLR